MGRADAVSQPVGERDVSGGITKAGDVNLRNALCQAATVMMHRGRASRLRIWAAKLARRRGAKCAMVALARRVAVILHPMWKMTPISALPFRCFMPTENTGSRLPPACSRAFDVPWDAVPVMPCSGPMPIISSTPIRWARWNCIEPASCWRPQRRPWTEARTRVDLRRRLPNREADHLLEDQDRAPAAHPVCAKPLDWGGPVTEGLTLVPHPPSPQGQGVLAGSITRSTRSRCTGR